MDSMGFSLMKICPYVEFHQYHRRNQSHFHDSVDPIAPVAVNLCWFAEGHASRRSSVVPLRPMERHQGPHLLSRRPNWRTEVLVLVPLSRAPTPKGQMINISKSLHYRWIINVLSTHRRDSQINVLEFLQKILRINRPFFPCTTDLQHTHSESFRFQATFYIFVGNMQMPEHLLQIFFHTTKRNQIIY